jgi:hypothetical protein
LSDASTSSTAAATQLPSNSGSKCSARPPSAGTTSRMNGAPRLHRDREALHERVHLRSSVRENST